MELKSGTLLQGGKYKIKKTLGHGSFGITYLATAKFTTDGGLGTMDVTASVAIKEFFMSDVNARKVDGSTVEGSTGSVFTNYRKKFRKEAENLAKLSHSNIVKVFDVFDENGTSYYVMEFLDGQNLDEYIKSHGRLSEEEAIKIIREVGNALSYMHSKKMLHLDIKPKNVMHRDDSSNYLIDFGLSKQYTEEGEPESSTSIGLGTPGYAPLEQSQYTQDGTFPATLDVYALGATLFKMLTGKRPPEATIILNNGFPYNELRNLNISEATIIAIVRSMNPIKNERWATVSSFIDNLPVGDNEHTIIEDVPKISPSSEKQRINTEVDNVSDFKNQTNNENRDNNKQISYKWPIAIFSLLIGGIWVLFMQLFTTTDYDFNDLDTDGWDLLYTFIASTFAVVYYLITRAKQIALKRWNLFKVIAIALFSLNTILLPIWNYSLTVAYVVLSIGLLLTIFVLLLINKQED